jgi:F-type H+-transporting ATPase subunit a
MSIIGLIFYFKSFIGSSLSSDCLLSLTRNFSGISCAYIFTMLSALYFGSAVEEHHHEEAHH